MPCAGVPSRRRRLGRRGGEPLFTWAAPPGRRSRRWLSPGWHLRSRAPFAPPHQPSLPASTSPKTRFALADLSPGSPGYFVRLTGNFAVGRDGRVPTRGYKDVRSRVLFPVHFDGRLGIGGELAIAPNDIDVSLRVVTSYVINSRRRCESQLMEPGLPQLREEGTRYGWKRGQKSSRARFPPRLAG